MEKSIFDIAREYSDEGKADRDRFRNFSKWRKKPTKYRLEALPEYLVSHGKTDELRKLAFDSKYLIYVARYTGRAEIYSYMVRTFLFKMFKKVPNIKILKKVGQLNREFMSLATLNLDFGELFNYVDDIFSESYCSKLSLQILIYTRFLSKEKKINERMSNHLIRLCQLIDRDTDNEQKNDKSESSESEKDLPIGELSTIIEKCLEVIINYDLQLSIVLSKFMEPSDLIHWSINRANDQNRGAIKEMISRSKFIEDPDLILSYINCVNDQNRERIKRMRIKETTHKQAFGIYVRPIRPLDLMDDIATLAYYDDLNILDKKDIEQFSMFLTYLKDLASKSESDITSFLGDLDRDKWDTWLTTCRTLEQKLFGTVSNYLLRYGTKNIQKHYIPILLDLFEYDGEKPYFFVSKFARLFARSYPFKEATAQIQNYPAWKDIANFKKLWIIMEMSGIAEETLTLQQIKHCIPEIVKTKIWIFAYLFRNLAYLNVPESLLKPGKFLKFVEYTDKFFGFFEKIIFSFKFRIKSLFKTEHSFTTTEFVDNFLAGDDRILHNIISSYHIHSNFSYSGTITSVKKLEKLRLKKIRKICRNIKKNWKPKYIPFYINKEYLNMSRRWIYQIGIYKHYIGLIGFEDSTRLTHNLRRYFISHEKHEYSTELLEYVYEYSVTNLVEIYFIPSKLYRHYFLVDKGIREFIKSNKSSKIPFVEYFRGLRLKRTSVWLLRYYANKKRL